jgi:hypothetical protein
MATEHNGKRILLSREEVTGNRLQGTDYRSGNQKHSAADFSQMTADQEPRMGTKL